MKAMTLWYSKTNLNRIGMWHYYRDKNNMIRVPHVDHKTCKQDIIEPPRLVTLNNVQTKMPNKIHEYLDLNYGKGKWKTELDCKKKGSRKCM